jgi:hypothetical protein
MKFTPEHVFSSEQEIQDAADLAREISDILDTVIPAVLLQGSSRGGHDVALISDLGDSPRLGRRVFVSEMRAAG